MALCLVIKNQQRVSKRMIEIKAPNRSPDSNATSVFLAGSIEMGKAELWQKHLVRELKDTDIVLYNPRRDVWDSSLKQTIENAQFNEQVTWELLHLEKADIIALYFDPDTISPISLLELGLFARTNKLIVCCPHGFWRKGNVDIICERYKIEQVNSIDELIERIKSAR